MGDFPAYFREETIAWRAERDRTNPILTREQIFAREALRTSVAEFVKSKSRFADGIRDRGRRLGGMVARGWIGETDITRSFLAAAGTAGIFSREPEKVLLANLREGIRIGIKSKHPDLEPSLDAEKQSETTALSVATKVKAPEWLDTGRDRRPLPTCTNTRLAIEALGIDCRYDEFHGRNYLGGHIISQWAGELSDSATQMLRVLIRNSFGFDPGRDNAHDAAVQLCLQNQFDPILDYLARLTWDGTNRLERWVINYLGADDTPLNRATGKLILVAAVRRTRQPGCKFDNIAVFEGPEGTGKSTAIEILAGRDNFSDQTILGLGEREQQEALRGVWLYEIADLAGMSKADVDKVKAFASRTTDRTRPAYGRFRVDLPRRNIFIGTTNNQTYLKSPTGNRRFLPQKTGAINLAALRRDRDQLWAEATAAEPAFGALALPQELWADAATEQEHRRDIDPWDEALANVKGEIHPDENGDDEERISTDELLTVHIGMSRDRQSDPHTKRLNYVMERLGWIRPLHAMRIGGKRQRGYRRSIRDTQ